MNRSRLAPLLPLAVLLALAVSLVLLSSVGVFSALPGPPYHAYLPICHKNVVPTQGAGATYVSQPGGCERIAAAGLTVYLDWTQSPPPCPSTGHRLAMIYGPDRVDDVVPDDIQIVVGYNEPHEPNQGYVTPTLGSDLWILHVEPNNPDKLLATPSAPIWWLDQWVEAGLTRHGKVPRFEYVQHHCYPQGIAPLTSSGAISYCQAQANAYAEWARQHGAKVLVTEFAHLPCWPEGINGSIVFMQAMVQIYWAHPDIEMWLWFQNYYQGTERWSARDWPGTRPAAWGPACNTSLTLEDGTLTPLGEAYKSLLPFW